MAEDCGCEITSNPLPWFQSFNATLCEMVGHGSRVDSSDSKCSSCASHSHYLILGVILAYYTSFPSHIQASEVACKSNNIFSKYQHCELHPDGVHDLDCFKKFKREKCVWKPGNHKSKMLYTLVIQQQAKNYCKAYPSITEFSTEIKWYEKYNITAEVFESSESKNCTKAVFEGSPQNLLRCGPPSNVTFRRYSGKLDVNVSWPKEELKSIKSYSVRYKALGSLVWNESQSSVEILNSSLVYVVEIQCVTNKKCTQCPWSKPYIVPSELTTQPVIVNIEEYDIPEKKGCRLITVTWKFSELHDGYKVTISKESGEVADQITTTQAKVKLILSYSAYNVSIISFNNASTSPAVSQTIPHFEDMLSMRGGKLNVTVYNNTTFTIYWKNDPNKKYVCYCVEWREKRNKALYKSFYEEAKNYKTISFSEPLKPYKKYTLTLQARPNKDTCNMKHVNNSEITFGSTQFYFIQGSPVSAPTNISSFNVTQTSAVLQWLSIPEEDIRGFLLGYIIHYMEFHQRGTNSENNITVHPEFNSYELEDLKSGTAYQVQISGFTSEGAGVRSAPYFLKTHQQGSFTLGGIIPVFAFAAIVLICGSPIIKRAKAVLWPNIPNPGNSNAMQKIDRPCELELLEAINTLTVEEWDTKSLQIVEKEDVVPTTLLPILPLLCGSEDDGDSPEMTCSWIQREMDDKTGDISPDNTTDTLLDTQRTDLQTSPFVFPSGYTTMEMFHQVIPPSNTTVTRDTESEPEDTDLTVAESGPDYVRQFSTSPMSNSDQMSTIL